MTTKRLAASTLLLSSMALGACTEGANALEPGDAVEVYHRDNDGTQTTLGYYEPDTQLYHQSRVGWDYEGFWFEANGEIVEVHDTASAFQTELALEVGATYDANLFATASDNPEDAVARGVIVVDTVAAERGAFEPATAAMSCGISKTWNKMNWSKRNCYHYEKWVCRGGSTFTKSKVTHLGACLKG